jgi:hypothetical protein
MEIGVAPTNQREVHAVVVDMPQRASLEYASPDTWGALPTFDPPEEESPTKPVLQVAPGCSALEIMAITGHKTLKEVERYTKDADQERMAERAIARTPSYPREVPSYPREKKA